MPFYSFKKGKGRPLACIEEITPQNMRVKRVRFDPNPTVFMYVQPSLTEEEQAIEQEEVWERFLESLKIGP